MWSRVFCGVSAEHIIECFVFYSMLGWAVESLYMSICNRKLTNRGFGVVLSDLWIWRSVWVFSVETSCVTSGSVISDCGSICYGF